MTKHSENTETSNSAKPMLANRLLKFRAFSNKDKVMYYGRKVELITSSDEVYCRILLNRSIDNPHNEYDINGLLTQNTGLKDKNGIDIYEGDILNTEDGICKIRFIDGCFLYEIESNETVCYAYNWHLEEIEVIGNVFENPDLLTQS